MMAVIAVVALLLLSLTGLSVWLVQQAALERARVSLVGQARTLAAAVDHEFLQSLAMLRTLAGSESLARGEMDRFDLELQAAERSFHGTPIGLIGPDGAPLSIMIRMPGRGPMDAPDSIGTGPTRAQAQPTISNLIYSSSLGGAAISITLPIIPPGATSPSSLLATTLPRGRLAALVVQNRLTDGLTGVVFDREMRFVARTGDDGNLVGQLAPPDLREAALRVGEGAMSSAARNIHGQPVVVAYARAALSGYVAAASVPAEAFAAPFHAALWQVVPIGATVTAIGLIAALLLGRRLGRTIGVLSALGRGEAAADPGFREVEEVAATLRREARQRQVAEEHQAVLVAELNHRVKNMLASVQSVADQTLRSAGADPHRFAGDFRGRLRSLARAHDLLTQVGWVEAELDEVLRAALAPWQNDDQQVRLEGGGRFIVSPRQAQALVLALHELATNAAKYGALSVQGGFVRLRRQAVAQGRVEILWQEVDGPRIAAPPQRRGFGTRLLERGLPTDLGHMPTTTLDFAPDGLVARIVFLPAGAAPAKTAVPARSFYTDGTPRAGLASSQS
ncbi:sensor histidine kinase [Falsiroseomonas sp. HC035]|uniref:sensor histidine kinase n=1 Tax=Falsiroseomonas sp. HC035 TaxID=3390999 RepID=UPI003D31AD15